MSNSTINGLEFLSKNNLNIEVIMKMFQLKLDKDFIENELINQLSSGIFFSEFFNFSIQDNDANLIKKYIDEAIKYKLEENWESAGRFYNNAGKISNESEYYVEAGNCYKRVNYIEAINNFLLAIDIYTNKNRLYQIANCYKEIAKLYEDNNDEENALSFYNNASKYYNSDNMSNNADECLLKVATLLANKDNFKESSAIFEKIGLKSLKGNISYLISKNYFIKSLYCLIATGNLENIKKKLEEYKIKDQNFKNSRECNFIEKLFKSYEDKNVEEYSKICSSYNNGTPFNSWETKILSKIKSNIFN
jgi:tetratricopeptide (TPR) repeat protein